jgi:hypothetical protein
MPDFQSLRDKYPKDPDFPERTHRLLALNRVLEGTLYAELKYAFGEEKNGSGEYVPLADRRPSARTRFCHTVVNDSVSMLFSEGHFPSVDCADEQTRENLSQLKKESKLNAIMINAAIRGSVGSIAILMRILKGRLFFDVKPTPFLTPTWDPEAPDTLLKVVERYKVKGSALKASGYAIADDELGTDFWFQRDWDREAETWYLPQKKDADLRIDTRRTTTHKLGFVPMVWIKNLEGGDDIDGAATFPEEAIDTQIEADYLLSQGGRGLKYSSDPTLLIKEPALAGETFVKGAANAVITSKDGDAKLLEISGDSAGAVLTWVKGLREIALEGMGGNRANAEKLSAGQSGRAMELLDKALCSLADRLKTQYGEGALRDLLVMIVKASGKVVLKDLQGLDVPAMNAKERIGLRWPEWYPPTHADRQVQAITLQTLRETNLMSVATCVKTLAPVYDIPDVAVELAAIKKDTPPDPVELKPMKPKAPSLSESND